jgi:hypothetical protein
MDLNIEGAVYLHLGSGLARGPEPVSVRIPLPVQRIRWDEQQSAITSTSSPAGYFKDRRYRYAPQHFIPLVTLHVPAAAPSFAATACIRPRDRATAPPGPTIAHARQLPRQEGSGSRSEGTARARACSSAVRM